MTSKCVISLDLPEDIVAPLSDQFDLLTWSGREAMPEATLRAVIPAFLARTASAEKGVAL